MASALFAYDQSLSKEGAAFLLDEGVEAGSFALNTAAQVREIDDACHKGVLIFREHGAGETTGIVKKLLGDKRDLILCAKLPDAENRQLLIEEGASEIITPRSWEAEHVAERILAQLILDGEVQPDSCGKMLGATAVMRRVYELIAMYARVSDPVLILGETGTGKDLVAEEIHRLSVGKRGRQDKLMALNCSTLRPDLSGSELFGHTKGTLTGAISVRQGIIAAAGHGTLFLDEFGELDLQVQADLLKVLDHNEVKPVGSNDPVKVHARIVLATNRKLKKEYEEGRFRQDLFRRIRGFSIELPPLRERRADIPLLARYFLSEWNEESDTSLQIPGGAFDCLFKDDWAEGNLGDLRSAVRKAATYADSIGSEYVYPLTETNELGHKLTQPTSPSVPTGKGFTITCDPSTEKWEEFIKRVRPLYFKSLLEVTGGDKKKARILSGRHHTQFYEYMKELDSSDE